MPSIRKSFKLSVGIIKCSLSVSNLLFPILTLSGPFVELFIKYGKQQTVRL